MTDLKGLLQSILCHLRLGLLGCSHFLWQVAQHKERLVRRNANKLARVGPEDLRAQQGQKKGRFSTHATCDGGLRRCGRRDRRVWAGCRHGASVLLAPSRRKPIQSGTSPRVRRHQRYLTTSGNVHMFLSTREKNKKQKAENSKITFCPEVNFKSSRLFKVPEDFDRKVVFSGGIPTETYIIEYNNVPDSITGFCALFS